MAHYTDILPNGLRLVCERTASDVVYCGYVVGAGTRHEDTADEGMAHFVEHLSFKGTARRNSAAVNNALERYGGDLNAYTNKQGTVYHATVLRAQFARAADLLTDIVFHSTFPQHEMDKECEVIVDEIESYNDSPSDLIFDRFEDLIYEGNSLGHDILGTAENVRRFKTEDVIRFVRRLYRPEKMVFFVFGNVEFEQVKKIVEKQVKGMERRELEIQEKLEIQEGLVKPHAGTFTENRGTHQAHVMIGRAGYGSKDDKRIALYFLNNILGGPGMNSRLNIALREHRGLVYTVESSLTNYTDTSTWAIYFGCDEEDVERCLRIVRRELDKLMNEPLTERQFQAALKQMKGQIGVACDNFENYVLDMAKAYLHYNKFEGMKDTIEHLEKVTPQRLQEVAREMFDEEGLTTLIFKS